MLFIWFVFKVPFVINTNNVTEPCDKSFKETKYSKLNGRQCYMIMQKWIGTVNQELHYN